MLPYEAYEAYEVVETKDGGVYLRRLRRDPEEGQGRSARGEVSRLRFCFMC